MKGNDYKIQYEELKHSYLITKSILNSQNHNKNEKELAYNNWNTLFQKKVTIIMSCLLLFVYEENNIKFKLEKAIDFDKELQILLEKED